jgi:hypothetical protein
VAEAAVDPRGITFTPLDNGIQSSDEAARVRRIADDHEEGTRRTTEVHRSPATIAGCRLEGDADLQALSDGNIAYVHIVHPVVSEADYTIMQTLYDA